MWFIWDKISNINAFTADEFLARNKHLIGEDVIYAKMINEKIVQVEGKSILAKIYGIDEALDDTTFIETYEKVLEERKAAFSGEVFDPYADLI